MILLLAILILVSVPIQRANAVELTAPEVTGSAAQYIQKETGDFGSALLDLARNVVTSLRPDLKEAAGVCLGLLATVLLVSLIQGLSDGSKKTAILGGTGAVTATFLLSANSMIELGKDTVLKLCEYGKLLLPVMTAGLAAQGAAMTSGALYAGTAFFIALLSGLIGKILIPMVYLFIGTSVANCATGESMLKRVGELIKWVLVWCLKTIVALFTGYLGLTGIVSGTSEAAVLKAAKTAISTAVPVVGGALSNAAESVLAGAAVAKNAAGIYGILAVLAIFLEPFLKIGIHYLLLKITAAVNAIFGCKELSGLIADFSEALGFLLAMTASVSVLLLISSVCYLKGVG